MQPTETLRHLWRAAGALLLCLTALSAQAQTQYGVIRWWLGADMYAESNTASGTVAHLAHGQKVEFVQSDLIGLGLWWKIRWQGKEGWISRALVEKLDDDAASAAPAPTTAPAPGTAVAASPAPQPRVAAVAPVAALPARPISATGQGRAVVFGISQYQTGKGIPTLQGVTHDMESANAMAQLMGISPGRIQTYRDNEITKASMAAILTQLAKEIKEGDPVLVYYSGHGGRIEDLLTPGRCIEGLITYDGQLITNTEMANLLHPLAAITNGLFVFFDACHSGGLSSTRAVSGQQQFTAKFVARGNLSNCGEIVNMLQSPPGGTRATGNRYVYAAAARANEISLDDSQRGGLATSNFLRCMVTGDGTQTVDSIRACAQTGIEDALAGNKLFKPHNMTITGDVATRPVRGDLSPDFKQQLLARASQGTLTNRPATSKAAMVSSTLVAQGWPQVVNPEQAFAAIMSRADGAMALKVDTPRTLKIDSQALQMTVSAPADGYLYVFQATGDGKNAVLLFPNLVDRNHQVRAGQVLDLPRASWPLVAGGPEGDNQLLVVFSPTERDLGQLVGQEAGPFLDLAVSPIGMQALAMAVSRSAYADDASCQGSGAGRPAYCSAAFAASLKTIREVR